MINADVSKVWSGTADFSVNIKLEFNQTCWMVLRLKGCSQYQLQNHVCPLTCCAIYPFRLFAVCWVLEMSTIEMSAFSGNWWNWMALGLWCSKLIGAVSCRELFSFHLPRPDDCFTTRKKARIYSWTKGLLLVTVQHVNINAICAAEL